MKIVLEKAALGAKGARLRRSLFDWIYSKPAVQRLIVSQFHRLFYGAIGPGRSWRNLHWLGTRILKSPFDLWIYQEIISERRPDLILETGTLHGGSALYLASLCDLLDHGRVVTVDIQAEPNRPAHPRITYLCGSSTDPETQAQVRQHIQPGDEVMVILDSDHRKEHVLAELLAYRDLVTPGQYLIVEDTNINGHPVRSGFGPGPAEAAAEFLRSNPGFVVDLTREKLLLTFHPGGFLEKVGLTGRAVEPGSRPLSPRPPVS